MLYRDEERRRSREREAVREMEISSRMAAERAEAESKIELTRRLMAERDAARQDYERAGAAPPSPSPRFGVPTPMVQAMRGRNAPGGGGGETSYIAPDPVTATPHSGYGRKRKAVPAADNGDWVSEKSRNTKGARSDKSTPLSQFSLLDHAPIRYDPSAAAASAARAYESNSDDHHHGAGGGGGGGLGMGALGLNTMPSHGHLSMIAESERQSPVVTRMRTPGPSGPKTLRGHVS